MEGLRNFRKEKGFTQLEMAERLKISSSYYIKIENDLVNPGFGFLKKLKNEFPEFDVNVIFEK